MTASPSSGSVDPPARQHGQSLGVAYSLAAAALFAILYYYATLLRPMSGEQVFGWRVALTLPFAAAYLALSGQWNLVTDILRRLRREPLLWLTIPVSAALLGVQLWLFMWAPINGRALDTSLGYFLLPLTLVATGRLVFGETLSRTKLVACLVAAVGVANELLLAQGVSWPAFVVCLGYPVYFTLRRWQRTDNQGGMLIDMALASVVGLGFIGNAGDLAALTLEQMLLIGGLGALSAVALGLMITASQRLDLALFGLLSYVEPILLVVVSLLLGERLEGGKWLTYGAIWLAVALVAWEGYRSVTRSRRQPQPR
jgi:chloramphenicol-sensitive protein RarD